MILRSLDDFVHVHVKENNDKEWVLTIIYKNPNSSRSNSFWEDIATIAQSVDGSC